MRTSTLIAIGGWDPFNVTEDADLGIRIARMGFRSRPLAATTFEEAPIRIAPWLAQRTRWLKGYMQTYLVHMRSPRALWKETGGIGFLVCQILFLGTVLSGLFNPVLWALFLLWLVGDVGVLGSESGQFLFVLSLLSLAAGNAMILYLSLIAPLRRRWYWLIPWALAAPLYWLLISVAAWLALFQLFIAPFHWSKTSHGHSRFDAGAQLGKRRQS